MGERLHGCQLGSFKPASEACDWQKDLAWAKEKAKHEELVEPPAIAGHGWWQLTRKGRDFDATKQDDRYE